MNLTEAIIENQKKISDLGAALSVYNSALLSPKVRAKSKELHERLLYKLQQLEIEGQKAKIETMEQVRQLYRGTETV